MSKKFNMHLGITDHVYLFKNIHMRFGSIVKNLTFYFKITLGYVIIIM